MLYIITEDSNSARVFWEYAAKTFRGEGEYEIVSFLRGKDGKPSSGNTTLSNQLEALLPRVNSKDEIMIVFDNIVKANIFDTYTFLKYIRSLSQSSGINIKFTSYYCFEEVYLSYSELERLNESNRDVVINSIRFVRNCLLNGIDYFDLRYKQIIDFIDFYGKDSGKNREHFANALLISVTQLLDGRFRIIKSGDCFYNQGACWLLNCDDVRKLMKNEYEVNSVCRDKCKFKCKDCTTKEKLIDLNDNSMITGSTYDLTKI